MRFLLDTNAVIALMQGRASFLRRIKRYRPSDFALPAVVMHELAYGAYRSRRRDENLRRLAALPFAVLPLDAEDAEAAGRLRAQLAEAGQPIGPYDVLIAGQALARQCTVITHNTREFARVPDLRCEDWQ
jgi:tRNA(fMet)-specific endonuclease VapC